jgi:hypothetical protein
MEVGVALGVRMEEMADYEEREPKNLKRRLFRMLVDWKQRTDSANATVDVLVTACETAGVGGAVKRKLGIS